MQGDLAMLGGLRTAWRETVLSVKASAKLALGIGAAATAIAGMPATAVVLLEALAVIAAAELADDAMRYWFDRELLDSWAPDIKVIELGDKMIDQTLGGLIAIIEGSFEIKDIATGCVRNPRPGRSWRSRSPGSAGTSGRRWKPST